MTNAHEYLFRKLKKKSQEELVALLEQLVQRQPETEPVLELLVELPLGKASAQTKQRLNRTVDPAAPLCDLKATQADLSTQQLVDDYSMWFANR